MQSPGETRENQLSSPVRIARLVLMVNLARAPLHHFVSPRAGDLQVSYCRNGETRESIGDTLSTPYEAATPGGQRELHAALELGLGRHPGVRHGS